MRLVQSGVGKVSSVQGVKRESECVCVEGGGGEETRVSTIGTRKREVEIR